MPLGSLRDRAGLPGAAEAIDDDRAREMLRKVQLAQLVDQLDDEDDWARRLSPGEQQRLGFARILIGRPKVVFLDEATSAVDEGLEHMLYELLRTELPDMSWSASATAARWATSTRASWSCSAPAAGRPPGPRPAAREGRAEPWNTARPHSPAHPPMVRLDPVRAGDQLRPPVRSPALAR